MTTDARKLIELAKGLREAAVKECAKDGGHSYIPINPFSLLDLCNAAGAGMGDSARLDWLSDMDNAAEIGVYGAVGPDMRARIDAARGSR